MFFVDYYVFRERYKRNISVSRKVIIMTLKELLRKTYWGPKELSLITGMSLVSSRKLINKVRSQIHESGLLNINKSKAPVKRIVNLLDIDIEWLSETGAIDEELVYKENLLKKR